MLGSEVPVRHPIRGEFTGWRTDNLRESPLREKRVESLRRQIRSSERALSLSTSALVEANAEPSPLNARRVDSPGATRDRAPPGVNTNSIGPGRGPTGLRPLQCPLAALLSPFGAALRFALVGQALRVLPCGGLPLHRIMEAYVEQRTAHCPRCGEPATRIVRGIPDPKYVQDLERAGIDYELGGLMAFEESSEWRCRSCRYEWRGGESSILG